MRMRAFGAVLATCALVGGGSAAPAFGWFEEEGGKPPKEHCNSGNGNGSDPITFVTGAHCYGGDPGNSYLAGNRGGDEIPTSGGVSNPGGRNVP